MTVKERQLDALRSARRCKDSCSLLDHQRSALWRLELERDILRARRGPGLIIIDYQEMVLTRRIEEGRANLERMGQVFEELRRLAMEFGQTYLFQHR